MDNVDIEEMFSSLGPITIKRLFGGKGIYHRDIIIAIEHQGEILLKGDDATAPLLEEAGCRRWAYQGRKAKPVEMPYWSIPDEAFDDPDIMARWVRLAYEAAIRAEK